MNNPIRFVADQFRRASVARDPNLVFDEGRSFGERLADRVATIGGSWKFIIGFSAFLVAYAAVNSALLRQAAFDPFRYIFLNLILSMLAAVQAPIIMMSQNRQAAKDRFEARLDYEINQRTEAQIGLMMEEIAAMRATMDSVARSVAEQGKREG